MKYKICEACTYKNRPKFAFPCDKCDGKCIPLTCKDCRNGCTKKGIRPCKEFEWD